MSLYTTDMAKGIKPAPSPVGSELMVIRTTLNVAAALAAGDIISMIPLPVGCVPVDLIMDWDAMGAGTLQAGLLKADLSDIDTATGTTDGGGAAWLGSAGAIAVTNAGANRADTAGLLAMARTPVSKNVQGVGQFITQTAGSPPAVTLTERFVGIKCVVATTATTGTIGLTLMVRAERS
jgi:hypothetical protein